MNPFSLPISDPELYVLREEQRLFERAVTAEQRLVPIHLRKEKLPNQMLEQLRKEPLRIPSSKHKSQRSHSFNRENIHDLILRKREILLTKKKIEHKKNSISLLDALSHTKEEEHKKAAKSLEDNLVRVEKYEEALKADAKAKADLAEKKVKLRIEKQLEMNSLEQEIDRMHGKVERKTEELRHLCIFKEFVEELSTSSDPNKSNTFMTQNSGELYSPNILLRSINALEQNNLFLIQQAQEAEQNLENLKSKGQIEESALNTQNNFTVSDIKHLERQKESTISKFSHLTNERSEEPLVSKEAMDLIHQALMEIYSIIDGDPATFPTDFEVLEELENAIRAEIEKTKLLGEEVLRQKEKEIDKLRRVKNVELLKYKEVEKAKKYSENIERSKQKVEKKIGRRGMERSKIPEKAVEKEKIVIPQEILDRREFLEEYIPYP